MTELLDFEALAAAEVHQQPYPYFVVEQSLITDRVSELMQDFPELIKIKSPSSAATTRQTWPIQP